jgi:dCMP deaminase
MSLFLQTIESIHPENRVGWEEYFMGIALLSRSRSPCRRLQVGCVIVKNNRIVSVGYNGFLPGAPHTSRVVNNHEQGTVHAEQNAVADAASRSVSIEGGTAYITHYPCINCFKILAASKIKIIYYHSIYKIDPLVKVLANEVGIQLIPIIKLSKLH